MTIPSAHVVFVLDDSGSMLRYAAATQEAFNVFVETLKECKGAEIRMTLIKFGDKPYVIFQGLPIQDVPVMKDYNPRNSRDVIYDSIAEAIKIAETDKRATKVVICVQADGGDTSSRLPSAAIRKMVAEKRALGWEFNYMYATGRAEKDLLTGAMDDHAAGGYYHPKVVCAKVGIPYENTLSYRLSESKNIAQAFSATALGAAKFSSGRASSTAYEKEPAK